LGRLEEALVAYEGAVELDPEPMRVRAGSTAITARQQAGPTVTLRFQHARMQ